MCFVANREIIDIVFFNVISSTSIFPGYYQEA